MARRAPAAAGGETLTYAALRRAHVAQTLRALARRRQSLLLAAAAFTGPLALALLEPVAIAMRAGVDPAGSFVARAAFAATWIAITTLLVMALREAVFMRAARPFLRALPVARAAHWRADAASIVLAYGLVWLQVAYALVRLRMALPPYAAIESFLALAGLVAVGVMAQSLLFQARGREWIAVTAAAALVWAAGPAWGDVLGVVAADIASLALLATVAVLRYERPLRAGAPGLPPSHGSIGAARMALATLRHEFREAVGLRLGAAALTAAAGAALGPWGFCGKAWGVGVAQLAVCALLLHRFPAIIHEHLGARLAFLYRLRRVRVRALAAGFGVSAAAFATTAAASAGSWGLACGALDTGRWTLSVALFAGVFVVATLAAPRLRRNASAFAGIALAVMALALATLS